MKHRPEPLKSAVTSHIFPPSATMICQLFIYAELFYSAYMLLCSYKTFAKKMSFYGTGWKKRPACIEPIFFLNSCKKKKKHDYCQQLISLIM